MSFMAALTAAAPVLIPAAIGAAGGAGLGALTSEDGFSDDGWWQGMFTGGLGGGLGGAAGLFSPGGGAAAGGKLGGLLGETSMSGSQLGANLGAGPISTPSGMDWSGMWNNVNSAGEYIGTNPDLVGQGTGLFGMHGSMMPSNDTMMKGLLGSQILKGLTKQDPKKEWTPQQARISPIGKMGAPMQLSRRGGQPGGAFMGGGRGGSLGSRRYS